MVIDQYAGDLVVNNNIALNNHIICGHHQNAGTRWNAGYGGARRTKVGGVVIENKVIANNHIVSGFDRQPWGDKREDAAGVVMGVIVFDDGVTAVFDFNTGDAVEDFVVGDMDIVTHADINSGISYTRDHIVLDQPIGAELRKDTVDAGIDNNVIANLKIIAGLTHNAIAFVAGNFKIFDEDIIPRVENRVIELAEAVQRCALASLDHTDQMNIIFVDIDGFRIDAGHHLNGVAGLRGFYGSLNRLARINH